MGIYPHSHTYTHARTLTHTAPCAHAPNHALKYTHVHTQLTESHEASASNQIALGSVGPLLGPLYARQEGGITLVSIFGMSQAEAIKYAIFLFLSLTL